MTTSIGTAVPASPLAAANNVTKPVVRYANITPAKITKTRVEKAKRDIERATEALDKAIENLAAMAAGKDNSMNTTVRLVVGVVQKIGTTEFMNTLTDQKHALDGVLSDLSDL